MSTLEEANLSAAERAAVEVALADDPALGEELEAIARVLGRRRSRAFWRAFAAACSGRQRPAAAVLPALEAAAALTAAG